MMNSKVLRLVSVTSVLSIALVFAASGGGDGPHDRESTPYPSTITWDQAAELLATGEVSMVMQTHALDVIFFMNDGSSIKSVEPRIDEIFRLADACGAPCTGMALATE